MRTRPAVESIKEYAVNQGPINIVVVDREMASRSSIKGTLTQMGVRVVGETEAMGSGLSLVSGLRPHILIMELAGNPDQALQAVSKIKNEAPEMGVILTARDSSPQLILRCMRAGAQEFLARPIDPRELAEAVKRLALMIQRAQTPKKQNGKIITVFSNKGGVGVTSIATNLAVSFAMNARKRTALVDLNMQMGEVALQLDLNPTYTIADALGPGQLDESRLKGLLTEHESGVAFLTTPEDPVEAEMISPDLLLEVMSLLKGMFDIVIVDAGHSYDSRVLEVMNLADTILVIAGLDVPTVRNIRRCMTLFEQLGYGHNKIQLLVNREQKKSRVTVRDLEETAKCRVFWQLPSDYNSLISAIDAGVPAVMQNPRARISRGIEDLTFELCQLHGLDGGDLEDREADDAKENGGGLLAKLRLG